MALSKSDAQLIADTLLATKLSNGYTVAQNITNATQKTDNSNSILTALAPVGVTAEAVAAALKKAGA